MRGLQRCLRVARTLADLEAKNAIGDVNGVGTPKAGVFAEGSARVVGAAIIARLRGEQAPPPYDGRGSCYVEFGHGLVGRVDVDFLSGPKPTGAFQGQSEAFVEEKRIFGSTRRTASSMRVTPCELNSPVSIG